MRRSGSLIAIASVGALLALPGSAGGAVTIGADLTAPPTAGGVCGPCTAFNVSHPTAQLTSPINGVVVRYGLRKGASGTNLGNVSLRILRPAGLGLYDGVGTSTPMPTVGSPAITIFPARLPIQVGDYIGMDVTNQLQERGLATASVGFINSLFADSAPPAPLDGTSNNFELLLNADIELDADHDGFGDETQDPCPGQFGEDGCDRKAPETSLTKGPKKKIETAKRKVRVKFSFSSDEPGSAFECKLDKRPYAPCASPKGYRIKATEKARRHTFLLRATDPAGNVDPTPVQRRFKVKRVD